MAGSRIEDGTFRFTSPTPFSIMHTIENTMISPHRIPVKCPIPGMILKWTRAIRSCHVLNTHGLIFSDLMNTASTGSI